MDGDSMRIEFDNIAYEIQNDIAIVKGLSKYIENMNVVIPETIQGYNVEKIDSNAFFGMGIHSVVLPYTLKTIGDAAFAFCENLEYVSHSKIVNPFAFDSLEINAAAFAGCRNLKKVNVSKYLKLTNGCFMDCRSLRSLDAVSEAKGEVFRDCKSLSCVTFVDNCNLSQFLDYSSKIKKYNFLGNAILSDEFIISLKKQNINVECNIGSNLCELAYDGISVYAIDFPF
jgi:hypothetical protein